MTEMAKSSISQLLRLVYWVKKLAGPGKFIKEDVEPTLLIFNYFKRNQIFKNIKMESDIKSSRISGLACTKP
jgi:hypothetical protein